MSSLKRFSCAKKSSFHQILVPGSGFRVRGKRVLSLEREVWKFSR